MSEDRDLWTDAEEAGFRAYSEGTMWKAAFKEAEAEYQDRYDEGYNAHEDDVRYEGCPYDGEDAGDWQDGWMAAFTESGERGVPPIGYWAEWADMVRKMAKEK
jgi:hypothetical protein